MTKVALVTGGTRGIGFGIVETLYDEGFLVACLGRKLNPTIETLIKKSKGNVKFIEADIGSIESINTAVNKVVETFGRIDLLVNNAGVAPKERNDILKTTPESFDFVLDINLKGTYFMTQAVANVMINQTYDVFIPKIINVSSLSAYASSTNRGEYCISKAGIGMVTTLFADRLAEYGILVYEIRPGVIKTDMTEKVSEKYDKQIENGLFPIKRWGYPEDIAGVVSLLSSPKMRYSTGDIINVDGGYHIRRL
ncbi:NAD(P)-dependent dehydrogenase (short-subunit alcohol dehydrogenase family) [Natranaerovirga hydrolytica]|uniref:NAD(P)-dependent dehydrogenase (Short-subunit alcohol dehydrogenase family) n=1 Tax=Natranaerovirga hydrolytica TaxID=680378 RepID=A0A4R1N124_9FIRM|nr:3-ketoacyl-ACP reductase [Natranaerovirga hydrolytica]TCK98640.1 NAD(P)-dependent dehydrogenase (short-subunit alcohol dehydrogenase family) [Natranaerovirga hydrolytica]